MPSDRTRAAGRKPVKPAAKTRKAASTTRQPRQPKPATTAAPAAPGTPRAKARAGGKLTIEQYGSGIGCMMRHKKVLKALGLRHPHHRVERPDNPAVRGMVRAVRHLARIVES